MENNFIAEGVRMVVSDLLKEAEKRGDVFQLLKCQKELTKGIEEAAELIEKLMGSPMHSLSSPVVKEAPENPASAMKERLKKSIEKVIRREFDWSKQWMEGGIESKEAINITKELERDFATELYPTLMFEYQNLKELTQYFLEEHAG